jgi:hypothetical protein
MTPTLLFIGGAFTGATIATVYAHMAHIRYCRKLIATLGECKPFALVKREIPQDKFFSEN